MKSTAERPQPLVSSELRPILAGNRHELRPDLADGSGVGGVIAFDPTDPIPGP